MNKSDKAMLIAVIIIAMFGIGTFAVKQGVKLPFKTLALASTFTPIYCNDYEFTCCTEIKEPELATITLNNDEEFWQCPQGVNRCLINSMSPDDGASRIFTGASNCKIERRFRNLYLNAFGCDDEKSLVKSFPITINSGNYIFFNRKTTFVYSILIDKLLFSGGAGSSTGVRVSGADRCTFQTNKDIYSTSGTIVKDSIGTISYTVNRGECILSYLTGKRHICGNFEEQCKSDNECGGHSYGNLECNGRTLQQYGCRKLGFSLPSGVEQTSSGEYQAYDTTAQKNAFGNIPTSRCEIISAKGVQCCGDTDCGSNAVCDANPSSPTAWTCKQAGTVQCRQDYDCGVSIQCDINTKQVKQPYCNLLSKCDYKIVSQAQCCANTDCAIGFFCDVDRKCKEGSSIKTTCPSECCQNEPNHFDRPCKSGSSCVNNRCVQKPPESNICKSCFGWLWNKMTGNQYCTPQPAKKVLGFIPIPLTSQNKVCPLFLLILLAILLLGGAWGYSIYKKKKKYKKRKK